MKKNRWGKCVISFILLWIFIIPTIGCDKYTRYKVLTFFFTGVPPIDEETVKKEPKITIEKKKRRELPQAEPTSFVHGPFGAGQCNQCHEGLSSAAFRTSAKEETKTKITKSWQQGLVPGRLVVPIKELCIECHVNKSVQSAFTKNLWIHGPVSDGLCTKCHSPHQSPFEFMLIKGKTLDLCTQCHAKGYITEIKEHTEGKECILCHNAHMGKDRFLLKKDYTENF
ncbi:hypothetical protein HZA26_03180 [Candidatus Nomurabacteria bacterium]|nr:hypothetical protein [Candidatus Nomurabacteria bacterium]